MTRTREVLGKTICAAVVAAAVLAIPLPENVKWLREPAMLFLGVYIGIFGKGSRARDDGLELPRH